MRALVIGQHSAQGTGGPAKYLEKLLDLLSGEDNTIFLVVHGGISSGLKLTIAKEGITPVGVPSWGKVHRLLPRALKPLSYFVEAALISLRISRIKSRVDRILVSHCSPGRYLFPFGALGRAVFLFHSEPVGALHRLGGPWFLFLIGRNAKLVAVSDYVRNQLLSTWGSTSEGLREKLSTRLVTVKNPSFQVTLQAKYIAEDRHVVLMAGGANWYKNPWLWLKVAALVLQKTDNKKLTFRWIGHGPLLEDMKEHVRHIGMQSRIILPGYVNDVRPHYESARLYMQLSRRESMGIAAADALRAGLPMIVSNVGGLPETVDHGINGLVVEPSNPREIAVAVFNLLEDQSRLQSFSLASRAKMRNDFSPEVWRARFHKLLSE